MKQLHIFVMERSWILVALWEPDPNDFLSLKVHKAAVVRRWGTTKGLGELASEGPQTGTVLDEEACDQINRTAVKRRIACDEKAWAKWMQQ
jgi:hypothetical protein